MSVANDANNKDSSDYKKNSLNQNGTAPKIVDETTPGESYELPPPWIEWLEQHAKNARIIKTK
jgi:hypothetical protein